MVFLSYFSDLRARLEVAIDKVLALAKQQEESQDRDTSDDYNSDSEEVGLIFSLGRGVGWAEVSPDNC